MTAKPDKPKLTGLTDLRHKRPLDADARRRVDAIKRGVELDAALTTLREERGITQLEVAERLATSRPNISRIEHESDVRLSTLIRYIEALGGHVEIVARFPDEVGKLLLGAPEASRRRHDAAQEVPDTMKALRASLDAVRRGTQAPDTSAKVSEAIKQAEEVERIVADLTRSPPTT